MKKSAFKGGFLCKKIVEIFNEFIYGNAFINVGYILSNQAIMKCKKRH